MSHNSKVAVFLALLLISGLTGLFGQSNVDNSIQNGNDSIAFVENLVRVPPSDSIILTDSLKKNSISDSIPADSSKIVPSSSFKVSKDSLEAPVDYKARDSIVYDVTGRLVHLYGEAQVKYEAITVEGHYIQLDWNTNTMMAQAQLDTSGRMIRKAMFQDGDQQFYAEQFRYNYKTRKGKTDAGKFKEGESYVLAKNVKNMPNNDLYIKDAKYTTCSLDHPHFHLAARRAKVVPDKVMVTGPANLVIMDIPTPLYVPFGWFPIKKGQRSGIVFPQYGEEQVRGFFLRNGGYYWAINDYMDLQLTGDIYSKGSWGVHAKSNYRRRYKYSGTYTLDFARNNEGERESPDFNTVNDFQVNWQHNQDPKARPSSRFTANVRFGTATYDRTFSTGQSAVLRSSLVSKISYSRSFPKKPFNFSVNLDHDQNLITGDINLTLPDINFGVSRIQPFKPKKAANLSKNRWYESIGVAYTLRATNRISGVDSTFFTAETFKNARYGIQHSLPISASFNVFKYFSLVPRINYTERWYMRTIRKSFLADTVFTTVDDVIDTTLPGIQVDTVTGFKAGRDFNFGLDLSTKIYGLLQFKKGRLKAIRHVISPTLSFRYRPDFGADFWGYYREVQSDTAGNIQRYSIFEGSVFGGPPDGAQAGLGISLINNLHMKILSRKDTVNPEKKVPIFENLTLSTFYNFIADSLRLDPINLNMVTSLFNKVSVNFRMTMDAYVYNENNVRINTFLWSDRKRFLQMRSASLALGTSLQSKKSQPLPDSDKGTENERNVVLTTPSNYYDFNIPWTMNVRYNITMARGASGAPDSLRVSTNSVGLSFDVNVTKKWKLAVESGYDFVRRDFVYTNLNVIRDLHCWVLQFNFTPYPVEQQQYLIQLNVRSALLTDLKLTRRQSRFDSAVF